MRETQQPTLPRPKVQDLLFDSQQSVSCHSCCLSSFVVEDPESTQDHECDSFERFDLHLAFAKHERVGDTRMQLFHILFENRHDVEIVPVFERGARVEFFVTFEWH